MAGELTLFYAKLATEPDFYNQLKKTEIADLNRFLEAEGLSPKQIHAVKSCDFRIIMEALFEEQEGPIFMGPSTSSSVSVRKPPRRDRRPLRKRRRR